MLGNYELPAEGYIVYMGYEKAPAMDTKRYDVNVLMPDTLWFKVTLYFKQGDLFWVTEDGDPYDKVNMGLENIWYHANDSSFRKAVQDKQTGKLTIQKEPEINKSNYLISHKVMKSGLELSKVEIRNIKSTLWVSSIQKEGIIQNLYPSKIYNKIGLDGLCITVKGANSFYQMFEIKSQKLSNDLFDYNKHSAFLSSKTISNRYFVLD